MFMFDSDVAEEVGVEAAVLFQNILFWIEKNKANEKHFYENNYWTYNSIEALAKMFPFWSKEKVRRLIEKLKESDFILTGNYNAHSYDRTMWYSLTEKGKSFSQNRQIHLAKSTNGNGKSDEPIPDIKPDIKTYSNITAIKSSKNKYGEFNNVLLTDSELVSLVERFGKQGSETRIEKLSGYLASKGDKYKSHYATIINWAKMEAERNNNTPVTQEKTFNDSIPNMWEMKLK